MRDVPINNSSFPIPPLSLLMITGVVAAGGIENGKGNVAQAEMGKNRPTITRGLIHNEDSSHFFMAHDPETLTAEPVRAFIDQ